MFGFRSKVETRERHRRRYFGTHTEREIVNSMLHAICRPLQLLLLIGKNKA